jgi:hypothetical protein
VGEIDYIVFAIQPVEDISAAGMIVPVDVVVLTETHGVRSQKVKGGILPGPVIRC